tara:strand:+ start:528 stop:704 length:177 start_codon:yes stop_codon:yes gene_type:complete
MKDRRGYEADDLKDASKAVEKKGGKRAYVAAMDRERRDYASDKHSAMLDKHVPNGKMC